MWASIRDRFLRAAVATAVPAVVALYASNPWVVAATPLLMALSKAAREQWPASPWVKMIPF